MSRLLVPIALVSLLTSTVNAAACPRCPVSITYTTPSGCPALNCVHPTCTVTTTTTIPTSYCSTKTRTACPRSCAACFTETITEQEDPTTIQPTSITGAEPNTTINPGGPIITDPIYPPSSTVAGGPIITDPIYPPSSTVAGECAPYTITTTASNPACTFDTSTCIRPLCVFETTTTVPPCGTPVTETELATCATECPAGCATFTYTTSGVPASSTALN